MILGYICFNLLKKNEKQEEIIQKQQSYVNLLSSMISQSSDKIKEIDDKGTFKSDDEIGWFFDNIKAIQEVLDEFKNN